MPDFTTLTELYGAGVARKFIRQWFTELERAEEEAYWAEQAQEAENYKKWLAMIA